MKPEETYFEAERKALEYLDQHVAFAEVLGKPLVLDEFGIPRDLHSYSPEAGTSSRDLFYTGVFDHIYANAAAGGPFAGSNFWTWGGYGEASDPDVAVWRRGDQFTGDPPQEPQGRNSVFATDESTLAILEEAAREIRLVGQR